MKIKQSDLILLKQFINNVLINNPDIVHEYEQGNFPRSEKVKDLQKRFCFDLLSLSRIKIGDGVGIHGDIDLYAYMHDEHIYTALKAVCPQVTREY